MLGVWYFAMYGLAGCCVSWRLFPRRGAQTRLWLGLTLGCGMLMWFPSLFAFIMTFSMAAQWAGLGLAAALAATALLIPRRRGDGERRHYASSEPPVWLTCALTLPFLAVMAWMQYNHTLLPIDGALYTGQSTYGDMNLHLGIATGLVNQNYPPDYTILPGATLGYPFLVDAASASLYMMGLPLRWAFILPGVVMSGLIFWGFVMLSWEMTRSKAATALSFLLMFLNGGLGFAYVLDTVVQDPSRLMEVFTGFYKAPANLIDHNVRWVNVLVDMILPQRTTMAGWLAVIPALWLLMRCVREKKTALFVMLGVWAGFMPMIHTHSFLALGLISAGVMLMSVIQAGKGGRLNTLRQFLMYALIAVALAAPQLFTWTFPQTIGGGSLRLRFNWANWQNGSLVDEYFWFWIKNVGLIFIIMIPAAIAGDKRQKSLALGALMVYIVAELIQFQPNEYDNNKLFYVAFICMVPLCARYLTELYRRLKGLPGRRLIGAVFLIVSLLSGALSVARECVSSYQLYGVSETALAEYINESLPEHAVYLTGTQHNNAVSTLSGGRLVCGTPQFLYFHGVDYSQNAADARQMFEHPAESADLFEKYQVSYILVSGHERSQFAVDEAAIAQLYPLEFEHGSLRLYRVE